MLTFQTRDRVIKLEAPYLVKQWNPILNQLNVKGRNWKKIYNYTKGLKFRN